jgi:hypothetical protein
MNFAPPDPFANTGEESNGANPLNELDLHASSETLRVPDDYPFTQDQIESCPTSYTSIWTENTEYVTSFRF